MDHTTTDIALAGLLHDVGKLIQRAQVEPWKPAEGVPLEGQPVHATYTEQFTSDVIPEAYRGPVRHAFYHHNPERSPAGDKRISYLVALADKLSAGERSDYDEEGSAKKDLPRRQRTIFDRIGLEKISNRVQRENYLPLSVLDLKQESIFPGTVNDEGKSYDLLMEGFKQEARQDPGSPEAYLENILHAYQRYAWCVPSAYYHSIPDISLYDHSRMTAALAVCLADFTTEEIQKWYGAVWNTFINEGKVTEDDAPWMEKPAAFLLGGDISGIQDFIYTIPADHAAKSLRGRSFYLQLLTEAILRFVLRRLGLPTTNVIYSGGGHFFLLAPVSVEEKLPALCRDITRILAESHSSDLYLALDGCAVPASGFKVGHFPEYWSKMHASLAQRKQRRYSELGDEMHPLLFTPLEHGGNQEKTCSVCGHESESTRKQDDDRICSICESFDEQIGTRLPKSKFIALGLGDPAPVEKRLTAFSILARFGMQVKFVEDASKTIEFSRDCPPDSAVIWALDDAAKFPKVLQVPAAHAFRYTVHEIPTTENGIPITFDKLAEKSDGISRLGVLRMDVDSLGDMFRTGFIQYAEDGKKTGKNLSTLARLSTLSFQLSLFFEGWVKVICREYGNKIYAVYSGGDDLFLIGPWDLMPGLAILIRSDFAAYTGNNPDMHISGGMSFIHNKYPIHQAAEDAGDALDQAKAVEGKNAFSFLGEAVPWTIFEEIREKQEKLYHITQDAKKDGLGGPMALLQILQRLNEQQKKAAKKKKGQPVWGQWMWLGDYQLTRMKEREEKGSQLFTELEAILKDLQGKMYQNLPQWGIAARWAQLRLREKINSDLRRNQ